jgi:histidinol-phosphatase (PHP family)
VGDYLEDVERCRRQFPDLSILSGVEFGQPHIDADRARQFVDLSALDRVNGSLHTLPISDQPGALRYEPITLYRRWPAGRVIGEYLAEVRPMIAGSDGYAVFTHIDYPVRYWPTEQEGPFNPRIFEDAFRQAMSDIAGSGRALELNIGGPLRPWIPQWWSDEGGRAITFASDAHTTVASASNFYEAMAMAEHFGFRQGRHPEDFWTR